MVINNIQNCIVLQPEMFYEKYKPSKITGRDKQTAGMKMCLSFRAQEKPMHLWIYGKTGTGKTLTVTSLLKTQMGEQKTTWFYIDCMLYDTFYSVIDKIVRELRILLSEQPNTSIKMERFQSHLNGKQYVIVLDNIDWQGLRERNLTLYNFCEMENVGIVCISQTKELMANLDERVRSRFTPVAVEFSAYNRDEIIEILKHRADMALSPDSWTDSVMKEIADLSDGDSRIAIHILKNAASYAQHERSRAINSGHIRKGWNISKTIRTDNILRSVTNHQKILFNIIKTTPNVNSTTLRALYSERCGKNRMKPVKERTFHKSLMRLISLGLIKKKRANGKGNVWHYWTTR